MMAYKESFYPTPSWSA